MSRVSRIVFPLSIVSRTANSRECFCNCLASAYKYRARSCPERDFHIGNASLAALTAASTSLFPASEIEASFLPLAGLSVLKTLPDFALHHLPLIKSLNLDLCSLSHSSAKSEFSGAGLYSIVSNISVISILFCVI